jgi:hypothetical protein
MKKCNTCKRTKSRKNKDGRLLPNEVMDYKLFSGGNLKQNKKSKKKLVDFKLFDL